MSDVRAASGVTADQEDGASFISRFLVLSVVSGAAIALGRIATQLFAIHLGASPLQIGVIMGVEQAMMMSVAVPAGFLVSRFGVRFSYFTASIGPMLVYLVMPFAVTWQLLAGSRALIGLCIPFRIVSMNTYFLRELPRIGREKAGWYRGSQTIGLALIGPWLAASVTGELGYGTAFVASGVMFGLMGLASLTFFPETRTASDPATPPAPFRGELAGLLRRRAIFESCIIEHVSSATIALFATFVLVLAIKELGMAGDTAVSLIAFQGCATVASLFLLNRIFVRVSRERGYVASLAAGVAGLLCLGLSTGYAGLATGAVLLSLASAAIHFQNMTQIAQSNVDKSKASGLFNLAGMSGNLVGALGGGLLSTLLALRHVYLLWIVVLTAAAAIIVWRNRHGLADD